MTRQQLLDAMFSGIAPSVRREQGMRDAANGKFKLSSDKDYVRGYDIWMEHVGKK